MINFFSTIIQKTIQLLKQEPALLLPALVFQLSINSLQYIDIKIEDILSSNLIASMMIGWIIPVVIIESMVIFAAWVILKKVTISWSVAVNQYMYGIGGILLISAIYKPIDIIFLSSIVAQDGGENNVALLFVWILSMVFRILTFYFKYDYLTSLNKQPNILNSLKRSLLIFRQFKWVTIGAMVYWKLCFVFFALILSFILMLLPSHLFGHFIGIITGAESVFLTLFFLIIFLKIKPITNLNDN